MPPKDLFGPWGRTEEIKKKWYIETKKESVPSLSFICIFYIHKLYEGHPDKIPGLVSRPKLKEIPMNVRRNDLMLSENDLAGLTEDLIGLQQ